MSPNRCENVDAYLKISRQFKTWFFGSDRKNNVTHRCEHVDAIQNYKSTCSHHAISGKFTAYFHEMLHGVGRNFLVFWKGKSIASIIINKLILGALIYFLWLERNWCILSQYEEITSPLAGLIEETIRLKLMDMRFCDNSRVRDALQLLNIPLSCPLIQMKRVVYWSWFHCLKFLWFEYISEIFCKFCWSELTWCLASSCGWTISRGVSKFIS